MDLWADLMVILSVILKQITKDGKISKTVKPDPDCFEVLESVQIGACQPGMLQALGCCEPLVSVHHQQFLDQVNGLHRDCAKRFL